ncbi:hypothetical protein C4573_06895 [Candidatus Woesearchaeota archaeon]|nr:MAG: hypothetical protein C4573_06895 [Candidatus Woesearchaeota archaeon]
MSIDSIEIEQHGSDGALTEDDLEAEYVDYKIIHDDGSHGSADLRIMELEQSHFMAYGLLAAGVPLGSKVAETFFYPHSETSTRLHGIGSQALDFVLEDARKRDIKAVYAQTASKGVEEFFQKNGFSRKHMDHVYIVLA